MLIDGTEFKGPVSIFMIQSWSLRFCQVLLLG